MASKIERLPFPAMFFQPPLFLTSFSIIVFFFFATTKSQEIVSTNPSYYYNLCAPSTCNNLTFSYPIGLSRFCHHPYIFPSCTNDQQLILTGRGRADGYRVVGNITNNGTTLTIPIASNALFGCGPVSKPYYTVDVSVFVLSDHFIDGTHLNCTKRPNTDQELIPVSCLGCAGDHADGNSNVCYYLRGYVSYPECEIFYIFLPKVFNVSAVKDLRGYLQKGFDIMTTISKDCQNCVASGGRCGTSPDASSFVCFCPSSAHNQTCSDGILDLKTWTGGCGRSGGSKRLVIVLSTSLSAVALITLAALVALFIFWRKSRRMKANERGMINKDGSQTELNDLVQGISPKRFSFSEIKKFTTNFAIKLGEGGFGSVYKGSIQGSGTDHVQVAVKILKILKQSEKQFMNEVATVGRIHHNNLVQLLGYCIEGKRRALVYEFMEKGSLDKYIYKTKKGGDGRKEDGIFELLQPIQLYNMALETARGVLYLHEECRSTILHCDIKPHNVLLDSNFCAKVSDFGLARMIDKDHSHVSLTIARGTPGYMAPETWSKSYGQVTEKSDVYSYGMLLLEMAGGRKNQDLDEPASSQLYFPELVFNQVVKAEPNSERTTAIPIEIAGDEMNINDDDDYVLNKMCLVGLWCIQHIPSIRPSMSRVIQMLEGNAEIPTPPYPFPEEGRDI